MKKLLAIMTLSALSVSMMAALTAGCTITFKYAGGGTDELNFYEMAGYTDAFENGADATKFWNTGTNAVNVYSPMACGDLSVVVTNNIKGKPVGIKTNAQSTSYSFVFSDVTGTVLLYDAVLDSVITMVNGGVYAFTAAANRTINDRFTICNLQPTVYEICFRYCHLQVKGAVGDRINLLDADGSQVAAFTLTNTTQEFDLNSYAEGRYRVVFNGTTYLIRLMHDDASNSDVIPGAGPTNPQGGLR